jgi:hypothetical protein
LIEADRMSESLKGYTPALARLLGTTAAALYERQRALVRADLLDAGDGRGPGSGVRATGPAVALLLISVLSSEALTGSEDRVRALAGARPVGSERCPLTHTKSFLDAFAALLVTTGKPASVIDVTISRTADRAAIKFYGRERNARTIEFVGHQSQEPGVTVSAALGSAMLQEIAKDVHAMVLEKFNDGERSR